LNASPTSATHSSAPHRRSTVTPAASSKIQRLLPVHPFQAPLPPSPSSIVPCPAGRRHGLVERAAGTPITTHRHAVPAGRVRERVIPVAGHAEQQPAVPRDDGCRTPGRTVSDSPSGYRPPLGLLETVGSVLYGQDQLQGSEALLRWAAPSRLANLVGEDDRRRRRAAPGRFSGRGRTKDRRAPPRRCTVPCSMSRTRPASPDAPFLASSLFVEVTTARSPLMVPGTRAARARGGLRTFTATIKPGFRSRRQRTPPLRAGAGTNAEGPGRHVHPHLHLSSPSS